MRWSWGGTAQDYIWYWPVQLSDGCMVQGCMLSVIDSEAGMRGCYCGLGLLPNGGRVCEGWRLNWAVL